MTSRDLFKSALCTHPHVAALIARTPRWNELLTEAQELGAQTFEIHPLIELLLDESERGRHRLRDLDRSLSMLSLSDTLAADFSRRIVRKEVKAQREAAAALVELYVGAGLAAAGAVVEFIPRQPSVTPDIHATRNGVTLTIEMASVNVSDDDRNADVDDACAFNTSRGTGTRPDLKRGEISEHDGGVRVLAKWVAPMGAGDIAQRVQRLTSKKADDQLRGHPNPVLGLSFWHQFGVARSECLLDSGHKGARKSGELYAASYGRVGDALFEEAFKGQRDAERKQLRDGILSASSTICAVLWIFKADRPVLFESSRLTLDSEARNLLIDAFGLRDDAISRFRRQPSSEEVAVAAYFRWLDRGGSAAPEASLNDWLEAERTLRSTPR